MNRFAFVSISLALTACGGTGFSSFDRTGQAGSAGAAANPDAGTAGSGGTGGASTGSAGGDAGSVSDGGASGSGGAMGTGGAGTGGAAGQPGTGGNAGSVVDAGRSDAAPPIDGGSGAVCKVDSDCHLGNTCCECVALGVGEKARACDRECVQSACSAERIQGVRCSLGKCVLAPECDSRNVTCNIVPVEPCPEGQVQSVKGNCWGACVPASTCRTVTDCKACASDAHLCARQETQIGSTFRCVDVPAQCDANVTCGCAGSFACLPPFGACNASMGGKQLNCSCPTC